MAVEHAYLTIRKPDGFIKPVRADVDSRRLPDVLIAFNLLQHRKRHSPVDR